MSRRSDNENHVQQINVNNISAAFPTSVKVLAGLLAMAVFGAAAGILAAASSDDEVDALFAARGASIAVVASMALYVVWRALIEIPVYGGLIVALCS